MVSDDSNQSDAVLIRNIKLKGLLSFGPSGIDLPLLGLNVLIGPNGSGKSNLIEAFSLLRAAPSNLSAPVKQMGGIKEWLWKGKPGSVEALIEATVGSISHKLNVCEDGFRLDVAAEQIEDQITGQLYYRSSGGSALLLDNERNERKLKREQLDASGSILSQIKDAERYPVLDLLQAAYSGIQVFQNWSFGPSSQIRRGHSAHGRGDFLIDGGDNVALVLNKINNKARRALIYSIKKLFDGIEDVGFQIDGGNVLLFLEESGGRSIPATRLSDGTLRYLCLLAILLHPEPPPFIVIEEPELGLHPDVLPHIAELLQQAAKRTQIVATTHSRALVDAFSEDPECVVVCGKESGESSFERLDAAHLKAWLDRYSLGELWSAGELGGNRW